MLEIIYIVTAFLFPVLVDGFMDYYLISRKTGVPHGINANAFFFILLKFSLFLLGIMVVSKEVSFMVALLVLAPSVRWICHDLFLNYLRGLPLDYLGEEAITDKFLKRTNIDQRFIKGAAFLISLVVSFHVYGAIK